MNLQGLRAAGTVTLGDLLGMRAGVSREGLDAHLHAVVIWLLQAQAANSDGGIPAYYDLLRGTWGPSYPETTGYTIPTLLRYAKRQASDAVRLAALRMAEYELSVQLPVGGFPGFQNKATANAPAVAFDTGQIMFGLLAAHSETGDNRFIAAAKRAGDWLVTNQDEVGRWNDYRSQGTLHAIDTRVAWALLCLFSVTNDQRYRASARRQLDWTVSQQIS